MVDDRRPDAVQAEVNSAPSSGASSAEVPAPAPSPWGSLLTIFTKPRATFERLASRPLFGVALAVVLVFQVLFVGLALQSGAIQNDAISKTQAKLEERGTDSRTAEETVAQTEQFFHSPIAPVVVITGGVLALVFAILVGSGLLYFMGNLMLGAKLRFAHYVSAMAYGAVVGLVDQVVRVALTFQTGTMNVRLGLGSFLGEDLGFPGRVLDTLTDPLHLWALGVTALGVSVFAKKGFGFGILALLPATLLAAILAGLG